MYAARELPWKGFDPPNEKLFGLVQIPNKQRTTYNLMGFEHLDHFGAFFLRQELLLSDGRKGTCKDIEEGLSVQVLLVDRSPTSLEVVLLDRPPISLILLLLEDGGFR